MNLSIVRALMWEQYLWTRWNLLGILSIAAIWWMGNVPNRPLAQWLFGPIDPIFEETVPFMLLGLSHLAVGLYAIHFLFSFSEDIDLRLAIPAHIVKLPVSTVTIASCRLIYGLASTGLVSFGVFITHFSVFPASESPLSSALIYTVYCMLTFALAQALAWLVGQYGTFTAVMVIVPLVMFFYTYIPEAYILFQQPEWRFAVVAAAGIFLALTLTSMWLAVVIQRHGLLAGTRALSSTTARTKRSRTRAPKSFSSPEQALRWFEFRQQAWLLPIVVAIVFLAAVMWHFVQTAADGFIRVSVASTENPVLGTFTFLATVASLFCGLVFFAQDHRSRVRPTRAFNLNLPVSTTTLAHGKLQARAVAVAIVVGMWLLFAIGQLAYDTLPDGVPTRTTVAGFARQLLSLAAISWTATWIVDAFIFTFVTSIFGGILGDLISLKWPVEGYAARSALREFAGFVAILLYARVRAIVSTRILLVTLTIFLCCSALYILGDSVGMVDGRLSFDIEPLDIGSTYLVLAPLLTVPYAFRRARHR